MSNLHDVVRYVLIVDNIRYGVETIGFFAVPAEGPHGFFDLGRCASIHTVFRTSHATET